MLVTVSGVILAVIVACAVLGQLVAPLGAGQQDLLAPLQGPSASHLLGTDELGRDVLSRCIVGARSAVVGPLIVVVGTVLLGNCLGLLSGYLGGWADTAVMRWADVMYALPALLVAIVVGSVLGGGYFVAVGILIVLTVPYDARIVRSAVLEQRNLAYVDAARTLGLPARVIMRRHIWPNILPIVVAHACLIFAVALVTLAALSFVGIGAEPGSADWGRMLAESRTQIFAAPLTVVAPAALLVLTAATANVLGDWAYERLSERTRAT